MYPATTLKLAGVGLALATGAVTKHKTKTNHKAVGAAQNVGVAAAVTLASEAILGPENKLDGVDGVQIWMAAEALYNGAKGLVHGGRSLLGLFRKIVPRNK